MKKISIIFGTFVLLLCGCSGVGNGPVKTIQTLHEAAMEGDEQTFTKLLSLAEGDIGDPEEAMEVIRELTMELGGVKNIKLVEVKKDQLIDEAVEDLTEEFGNDWTLVAEQMEEDSDEVLVWLLKKVDKDYYIFYGEDLSPDEFLKIPN
ncbi:hypothetical protein [Oceanobacillus sp. Castelsardo]|uniref:hypothetical protein n=1 Tax=Oceanobacillus sp. Castelsardo TaxID=1851204 RepID=UPI0008399148|nr:hypothetical protein [Oceanobacillus sp. Castelsardo]